MKKDSEKIEKLRKIAHDQPMNKVFETHEGHRFLGSHSRSWADASNCYVDSIYSQDGD